MLNLHRQINMRSFTFYIISCEMLQQFTVSLKWNLQSRKIYFSVPFQCSFSRKIGSFCICFKIIHSSVYSQMAKDKLWKQNDQILNISLPGLVTMENIVTFSDILFFHLKIILSYRDFIFFVFRKGIRIGDTLCK